MVSKEFIVAIELGSSKVTGIAGQKNLDGSISVLAVAKEDSSAFIRKGVQGGYGGQNRARGIVRSRWKFFRGRVRNG